MLTLHVLNLQPLFCVVPPPSPPPSTPPMAVDQTSGSSCKERIFCFSTIGWDVLIFRRRCKHERPNCVWMCGCFFMWVCARESTCMHDKVSGAAAERLRFNTINFCQSWDGSWFKKPWPSSEPLLLVDFLQEVVQNSSLEWGGLGFLERLAFNFF